MKIQNQSKSVKFFMVLLDILSIAMLIVILIPDETWDILFTIIFGTIALFLFLIVSGATCFAFGNYELTTDAITFKSLFYKKTCKWTDFKFIARYYVYTSRIHTPKEGYICSFKLEENNLKRFHALGDFSNKFFDLPYSEKLEAYILTHGKSKYKGLLIDDRKLEIKN